MGRRTRGALGAVATAALAVLGTGCAADTFAMPRQDAATTGETPAPAGEPDPAEPAGDPAATGLLEDSVDALRNASSMHLVLETPDSGSGGISLLDVRSDDETNCAGTMTNTAQGTVEVVRTDGDTWMRPDREAWEYLVDISGGVYEDETIDLLSGRYLYLPPDDPAASTAEVCDFEYVLDLLSEMTRGPLELGGTTTYQGVPARTVHPVGALGSVLVAAEGEPYLLQVRAPGTEASFSEFGAPVDVVPPPDELVLDIADFRSGDIAA
ncbi:hypothetical protein [Streptomyces sp. NPDC049881]|uniref:hypothetical protein n=1 Tax=Streptomyces sp. NPDC049881 TaxID=3155778 RepID=UPI00343DB89B